MSNKVIIGSVETCNLPDLGITNLEVRIDTGAKTSSLHVDNLSAFEKDGKSWVSFEIHPDAHNVDEVVECTAPVESIRTIKSSNGVSEQRYVINSRIQMADQEWSIEITLSDRSDMRYMMLLGRTSMEGRVLVDPAKTFLLS